MLQLTLRMAAACTCRWASCWPASAAWCCTCSSSDGGCGRPWSGRGGSRRKCSAVPDRSPPRSARAGPPCPHSANALAHTNASPTLVQVAGLRRTRAVQAAAPRAQGAGAGRDLGFRVLRAGGTLQADGRPRRQLCVCNDVAQGGGRARRPGRRACRKEKRGAATGHPPEPGRPAAARLKTRTPLRRSGRCCPRPPGGRRLCQPPLLLFLHVRQACPTSTSRSWTIGTTS